MGSYLFMYQNLKILDTFKKKYYLNKDIISRDLKCDP